MGFYLILTWDTTIGIYWFVTSALGILVCECKLTRPKVYSSIHWAEIHTLNNVVKRASYLRDCVAVGVLVPLVLLVADAVRSTADMTSWTRKVSGHRPRTV